MRSIANVQSIVLSVVQLMLFSSVVIVSPLHAEDLALDEFLPPVQGGSLDKKTEVKQDADGTLKAESAQDGLNYAWSALLEEGDGVREINVPSGIAVLAVGSADYSIYANRDGTLLSKRSAYTRAMAMAQKNLADHFEGLFSRCTADAASEFTQIVTGQETVANNQEALKEVCTQGTRAILAGFVTYAVKDDTEQQVVTVSLASSNKTRNAVKRIGGSMIETGDQDQAWKAVISDIQGGFVPPLGARLITNPDTGQFIVIGYGSAILASSDNKKIQRKMQQIAKKRAQMRANNALVSFLNGSETYWRGGFDQRQIESREEFILPATAEGESPVANARVLDETKTRFLNTLKSTDAYTIAASGKLPPGVKQKTLTGRDEDWAYAVSVYSANATARAERQSEENRQAMKKLSNHSSSDDGTTSESTDDNGDKDSRALNLDGGEIDEGAENPRGPSGQVSNKSSL